MTATEQTTTRPYTGAEYLESIRDGRTIYFHGERVKDVTTHPAFRNSARSIARLYDALHDSEHQAALTCETDTGSGGLTHKFFRVPRSVDDLVGARDAIVAWQRLVYGWMGRSPDYKASFLGTLGANPDFYGDYKDNALRWYKESQEQVSYWNHAIVHPPVDRHLPIDEAGEVCMHVESENDNGLVVSGAKVVATGSALTHYNFIAHFGVIPLRKPEYAIVCTTPMDSPGVKLISRNSYELQAAAVGSPFDYPLSSRMDENDAILVFDKVLIPWENVFLYGDMEKADNFFPASGFIPRFTFHGLARLCVKLDFIAGVLAKALRATGTGEFRGVQANLGEVIAWRNVLWGLSDAMCKSPDPWEGDAIQPSLQYGMAYLRQLQRGRLQVSRDPALPRQVRPGLQRHRGHRPDQDHEAPVGRGGQRVRRASRAVRAELRREPRADQDRVAHGGPGDRGHGPVGGSGRHVHVGVRPRRLDQPRLHQPWRCLHRRPQLGLTPRPAMRPRPKSRKPR
jgi:4-hydroxyphenylacetate 3-monooxygenase